MSSYMFALALESLLSAETWEKKRQILEEQQEFLLTDEAIHLLERMARNLPSDDPSWITKGAVLLGYRGLLFNARVRGIAQAWAFFKMHMSVSQL